MTGFAPVRADFAAVVQAARRSTDASVGDLARKAGVAEADVRRVEDGDAVPTPVTEAICDALGLDRSIHVPGLPYGPVAPPVPLGVAHARALAAIGRAAASRPGWLVCPDVTAWGGAQGWTAQDRDAAAVRLESTSRTYSRAFRAAAGLGVAALLGSFALGSLATTAGAFAATVAMPLAVAGTFVLRTRRAERGLSRLDALGREGDGMCSTGFVVGPSGLTVLTVPAVDGEGAPGPVSVRVLPADGIYATRVDDVGEGHVTFTVDSVDGTVAVPWVTRTRAVTDAVAGWTAPRADAPWTSVAR